MMSAVGPSAQHFPLCRAMLPKHATRGPLREPKAEDSGCPDPSTARAGIAEPICGSHRDQIPQ